MQEVRKTFDRDKGFDYAGGHLTELRTGKDVGDGNSDQIEHITYHRKRELEKHEEGDGRKYYIGSKGRGREH